MSGQVGRGMCGLVDLLDLWCEEEHEGDDEDYEEHRDVNHPGIVDPAPDEALSDQRGWAFSNGLRHTQKRRNACEGV
jgi:hypothetical protein